MDKLLKKLNERIDSREGAESHKTVARLYVDDLTLAVPFKVGSLPMKDGRTYFSDDGRVSDYLRVIEQFSIKTGMKLNKTKTAAVFFKFGRSVEIPVDSLVFSSGEAIAASDSIKILGFNLDKNLDLHGFVSARRRSGSYALWQLMRLVECGVGRETLCEVCKTYVRSSMEFATTTAISMLSCTQVASLEQIQRRASRIIWDIHGAKKHLHITKGW